MSFKERVGASAWAGEIAFTIEERTPEYDTLIQGSKALVGMLFQAATANRMRRNTPAITMFSQAIVLFADMIHKAVAVGVMIERGRTTDE